MAKGPQLAKDGCGASPLSYRKGRARVNDSCIFYWELMALSIAEDLEAV